MTKKVFEEIREEIKSLWHWLLIIWIILFAVIFWCLKLTLMINNLK